VNKETNRIGDECPELRFLLRKSLEPFPARGLQGPTLMGSAYKCTETTLSAV